MALKKVVRGSVTAVAALTLALSMSACGGDDDVTASLPQESSVQTATVSEQPTTSQPTARAFGEKIGEINGVGVPVGMFDDHNIVIVESDEYAGYATANATAIIVDTTGKTVSEIPMNGGGSKSVTMTNFNGSTHVAILQMTERQAEGVNPATYEVNAAVYDSKGNEVARPMVEFGMTEKPKMVFDQKSVDGKWLITKLPNNKVALVNPERTSTVYDSSVAPDGIHLIGDGVLMGGGDVVDISAGTQRSTNEAEGTGLMDRIKLLGGGLYSYSDSENMQVIEASSGKIVAKLPTLQELVRDAETGNLIGVDYQSTEDNSAIITGFSPTGEQTWQHKLPGKAKVIGIKGQKALVSIRAEEDEFSRSALLDVASGKQIAASDKSPQFWNGTYGVFMDQDHTTATEVLYLGAN